jgi:hypothetical protein
MPIFTTRVNFNNTNRGANGRHRVGDLIADPAGKLSGTTALGGANGDGTVFDIPSIDGSDAGTPISLNGTEGAYPDAGLMAAAAGNLSGTTIGTFTNMHTGTAAAAATNNATAIAAALVPTLTTLVSFNVTNGYSPDSTLIADAAGDLFGTTYSGGAYNDGTVFEIVKTGGGYASTPTTLTNVPNATAPLGGLIADAAGDLFGTTKFGGVGGLSGNGTVFEIAKTGGGYASTPITLTNFSGTNGYEPLGGVVADAAGDLFGTTFGGGANGAGMMFEIAKTGGSYAGTPTTLVSFDGINLGFVESGLIVDAAGDLFGESPSNGAYDDGAVFEIAKTGGGYASTPNTLASFNGADGRVPDGGLFSDAAGDFFGTTAGGAANYGTVFEIAKTGGGYASTPTTLATFNGTNGVEPQGSLIMDAAGDIFGTTEFGGASNDGTVFEIAKTGSGYTSTPTILFSFNGTNGANPFAGLIADAAGDLFSTTSQGGANGAGTAFELTGAGFQLTAPPVLSGGGNSVNYTPQGTAVAVDTWLAVSDPSSATLAGATVVIGAGFIPGDVLNYANQNGIAGSYNASTGVLTLTGSASLADYQTVLESITFSSSSGNPSDWDTDLSRTVSWTVTDGTLSSNTIGSTIVISAPPPSSPPAGTTADMILRNGTNGDYVIFDTGNNAILAAFSLGQVGLEWQVASLRLQRHRHE